MFRGARRADLDAILKIYARARQAMADSGNPTQWGDHFPPQELLEEDIDSNRLFLYLVNGELEHCESLRADTHADNKIMQHLLEENGFTRCGIIHVEDGTPRIAYQKMSLTLPLRRD